jgi:hypothetical protein
MSTNTQDSENEIERKDRLSIEWRRTKVLEYSSEGFNQNEIAKFLQLHESTISRDMEYLRQESRQALQEYITKKLPDEVRKTFTAMDLILKTAWHTVHTTEDEKTKLNALNLINTVMASRVQLLANVDVVDKVIALVTDIKEKQKKVEQQEAEEDQQSEDGEDTETTTKEITNE